MSFQELFIMFWLISIVGWIIEEIFCSITEKRIVNRGFLIGPYCPIYGFGGVLMLPLFEYREDTLVCFILAFVIGAIVEYVGSYILEKLFKVRWWDYSNDHYNLNGRICLRNCIAFGLLGVIAANYLFPLIFKLFDMMTIDLTNIIFIVVFIVTLIDFVLSFSFMEKIKEAIDKNLVKFNGDSTEDIKNYISKIIIDNANYFQKRIVKTYHDFTIRREDFINNVKKQVKKRNKHENYTGVMFIIAFLIGLVTKKYLISFVILIPIGFIIDLIIRGRK